MYTIYWTKQYYIHYSLLHTKSQTVTALHMVFGGGLVYVCFFEVLFYNTGFVLLTSLKTYLI